MILCVNEENWSQLHELCLVCICLQVTIGPCTQLSSKAYKGINWDAADGSKPVRELLVAVFTREVLATSTLTGTVGNAYQAAGLEAKPCLDPAKLNDTIRKYDPV